MSEKTAGGMSYQTGKGIDYGIIDHVFAHDEDSSSKIFEKNKEYYLASANKTMTRLILAKTRINQVKIQEKESNLLKEKIYKGINRLKSLKENIQNADNLEFLNRACYKEWHVIKLIPGSAEGYAICEILEDEIKLQSTDKYKERLKDANVHNKKAKEIFLKLLNSDRNTNFKLAEKNRLKAYEELKSAYKLLH